MAQQRRRFHLSRLPPRLLNAPVKGIRCPEEGLETHRRCHVRRTPEPRQFRAGERGDRRMRLRPIDESEPLLRLQHHRREPSRGEQPLRRPLLPAKPGSPLSNQSEGQVREWRKISARPHAPLLRHHRPHPHIEHRQQRINQDRASPCIGRRQHIGTQQHHRTHLSLRQGIPNPCRMTANQIPLERCQLITGNRDLRKLSETRVDAVDRLRTRHSALHHIARLLHPCPRLWRQLNRS